MTLLEIKEKYKHLNPIDLEVFLLHVLQTTPENLFLNPNTSLSESQKKQLLFYINRREAGEPVAYIIQQKEFYGYNFFVTPDVLIPRPETEEMLEHVLQNLHTKNSPLKQILDIGTGSGILAVVLAKHIPNATITALDISQKALDVVSVNIQNLTPNSTINLVQSDFLQNISDKSHYDLIITNPPYIKINDPYVAPETHSYEPHIALYSGDDGLHAYRTILNQINDKEISFKYLAGEFGFDQKKQITTLLEQHFSGKYKLFHDYNNHPRFFIVNNN